jgi:DNA (cytosine-5)-methyltransferase 1
MNRTSHRVVSLFCGLGGFDLGFLEEGFEIIWANDNSPAAVDSYALNLGTRPICADIVVLSLADIPPADMVIGGPPCQSFSLVGRRQPDDSRGALVFRFLDVVRHLRPRAFALENVPGMAASRLDGRRLSDVLAGEFEALGYHVSAMKLTATDYLVPQRRRRLFLLGCLDGPVGRPDPRRFARACYGVDAAAFDISARAAIGDLGPCVQKGGRAEYAPTRPSPFARMMRRRSAGSVSLHECPRMSATDGELVRHIPPGGNYADVPDAIAPGRVLRYKKTGGRTTTYGRLHPERPAHTINTYFRRPNVGCHFHYTEARLITPREAMRFQALPDHFELCFRAQDERNRLIGNAVPPLLARAIAWMVRQRLDQPAAGTRQGRLFGSSL